MVDELKRLLKFSILDFKISRIPREPDVAVHFDHKICSDDDGTYCLPDAYTTEGRFAGLLSGRPTEIKTKDIIAEQYAGGDILHAGAFMGDFLPALSRIAAEQGGRVITCEPVPLSYEAASYTIELSGLENVELHRAALAASDGELELATTDENGAHYGQTARVGAPGRKVKVPTTTIDNLAKGRDIRILHLDLEGYESFAFEGAPALLASEALDLVIIENLQVGLMMRFLKGWTCVGEADNNYFFSRRPLDGEKINQARGRLREKFADIVASLPLGIEVPPADGASLSPQGWADFEVGVLNRAFDISKERFLADAHDVRWAVSLMKIARLGHRLDHAVSLLEPHFSKDAHPTVAYAYGALAMDCGKDLEHLKTVAQAIVSANTRHAEMALLASKIHQLLGNTRDAVDYMKKALAVRPDDTTFATRYEQLLQDFGSPKGEGALQEK